MRGDVRGGMTERGRDAERKSTALPNVTQQQPLNASCKWGITIVSFTSMNIYA